MILDAEELMDHSQAVALTYVEVYTLRRHALDVLLDDCPVARRAVERAKRRITLQRALLRHLSEVNGKRGPCSFITKSMAVSLLECRAHWPARKSSLVGSPLVLGLSLPQCRPPDDARVCFCAFRAAWRSSSTSCRTNRR